MQAGGHRFDPGQLHQPLIHCVQFGAFFEEGFDLEAGWRKPAGFNGLRAGLLDQEEGMDV